MRIVVSVFLLLISFSGFSQDVRKFQSTNINVNNRGENTKKETPDPTFITVNLETGTLLIETKSPEITTLFEGQMGMTISQTMGELGDQFSLTLGEHIFAHFYVDDRAMILFTRNDLHPMRWGLMLTEVAPAE
ncbi:MAG: hypothetical protein R2813_06485 [Flavobacteriales bacterium]